MPRISISQPHALTEQEAGRRLRQLMEQFSDRYRFETRWTSPGHAAVSGKGVKGSVELDAGVVRFDLQLSMLLSPFKSKIEEGIARKVATALGG